MILIEQLHHFTLKCRQVEWVFSDKNRRDVLHYSTTVWQLPFEEIFRHPFSFYAKLRGSLIFCVVSIILLPGIFKQKILISILFLRNPAFVYACEVIEISLIEKLTSSKQKKYGILCFEVHQSYDYFRLLSKEDNYGNQIFFV